MRSQTLNIVINVKTFFKVIEPCVRFKADFNIMSLGFTKQ